MRLIDADALMDRYADRLMTIEEYGIFTDIAEAPTVEAVPVEWIEAYMQSIGSRTLVGYRWIELMLEEWKEQCGAKMDGDEYVRPNESV